MNSTSMFGVQRKKITGKAALSACVVAILIGASPTFAQQHNALLSQAETTLPDQPRPGMGPRHNKPGMRQRGGSGRDMPRFIDYDANSDGQINQQEFTEGHAKRMQQRAAEGRKMRHMKQAPTIADIDTDSDGSISPEEFTAHQAQHKEEMKNRQ